MTATAPHESDAPPARLPFYINRNFALLWSGQAISFVGDFVFDTTLFLWIAARIGAGQSWAPAAVSGVLACVLVPTLLGGPIAGVFVDRWDKRRTMLAMDALRAILILSLLLASNIIRLPLLPGGRMPVPGQIGMIYVVVFLATICQQFFGPSRMALIGDVVDSSARDRASGLGQVTVSLAVIIGPPLAAPLLFNFGVQWALTVNALSFVVSFIAIALVHSPPAAHSVSPGARGNARQEFAHGLRFFAASPVLMTLLVATILAMAGAGALNALDIFFVTQNLHTSPSLYGYLSSAFGVGSLVGGILASIYAQRIGAARLFWGALLLAGLGLVAYSRLTTFSAAVVLLCILGIPVAGINVAVMPLVLQAAPRDMIGRVSAVLGPAISLASLASIALAGLVVSTVLSGLHVSALGTTFGPVDTVFAAGGILCALGGIYALVSFRRAGIAGKEAASPSATDAA